MNFFQKTLGGLETSYYIRHLIFGGVISAFMIFIMMHQPDGIGFNNILFLVVNTLLYPYARFVYESIVGFIMGGNTFFVNAIVLLVVKFFTMAVCWVCALFIAPVGLIYLYFHHSKSENASQ